jgi:hypothetical protein
MLFNLVGNSCQLIVNTLLERQPVEFAQKRFSMPLFQRLENDSSQCVLRTRTVDSGALIRDNSKAMDVIHRIIHFPLGNTYSG